ncbi:hypothetical protein Tco_0969243 [Tanacetum coccineum]
MNTNMTEGAVVADHAKLLLSWLPDTWSGIVTIVRSTSGTNKPTFKDNKDMILGEDIRRRNSGEYPNSFLNASDDAPSCCVEEYYESWVMDSGTSFHATPCMGMMKNFKLFLVKLTGDGDEDGESSNYETGDGDNINPQPRRKFPESPIPIRDGDGNVNRFPDGDGDGDEAEKQGWGWLRIFTKGHKIKPKRTKPSTEWKEREKVKSQSREVKVKDEAEPEEILKGPTRIHLMGRVSPLSI